MNIYYLKLSLSRKSVAISERSDVIDLIKRGIEVSNKSFSAQRYHRSLEYLDLQDPKSVLLAGSDDLLLKATVDLVYSSDEERKNELRELLLPYINEKKLR